MIVKLSSRPAWFVLLGICLVSVGCASKKDQPAAATLPAVQLQQKQAQDAANYGAYMQHRQQAGSPTGR